MHTVFINTTSNERNAINYSSGNGGRGDSAGLDVLKYEIQFKKLKYVNCPLKNWNDGELGYRKAIRDISRYIDTHNGVGNDYNLIVYADMREFAEYMGLSTDQSDEIVKSAVFDAYTQMAARLFTDTVYKELCDEGREPASKFLLLLEKQNFVPPSYVRENHGEGYSPYELAMTKVTLELLGILPMEKLAEKVEAQKQKRTGALTAADIMSDVKPSADFSFSEVYSKQIEIFVKSLNNVETDFERQCVDLCRAVNKVFFSDTQHKVGISEYRTNRKIQALSLDASRKRSFLLQCFIWDCVNSNTLFREERDESGEKIFIPKMITEPTDEVWDEVFCKLAAKKKQLQLRGYRIENNVSDYMEGYAPPLYTLDYERFGIDESGYPSEKLQIRELSEEELKKRAKKNKKDKKKNKKNKKKKAEETDPAEGEGTEEALHTMGDKLELVRAERVPSNWLEHTDYEFHDRVSKDFRLADPEKPVMQQYKLAAERMANSSLNIIGALDKRIARNLSRYAAYSTEKKLPFLRKRRVSTKGTVTEWDKNDYVYAKRSNNEPQKSEDPVDVIEKSAPMSYQTIVLDYLRFESGRGIELKNVKDTCLRFINRMDQIESAMKKAAAVLGTLALLLLLLYVPFVLIQFEAIFENFNTFLVALLSLAIPFAVLAFGYVIAKALQKREIDSAWETLKKDCRAIDFDNDSTIRAFDRLLTWHIPSLRWMYEYLLDIDFHRDCLRTANARFSHHKSVLDKTEETIGNILEDFKFDYRTVPDPPPEDDVDYSTSPYEGNNYERYSIVDKDIIKTILG